MNPVLQAVLEQYVGGELEIQNIHEGYAYRGEIKSVEALEADDSNGALLKVQLVWNAKAIGEATPIGFLPTGGWEEDTKLEYVCNTDLPSPEIGAPNLPNVSFVGEGRMAIHNPYTHEMTVLFPRDGSKLPHDKIRWLPDGPKAKHDAAKVAGSQAKGDQAKGEDGSR